MNIFSYIKSHISITQIVNDYTTLKRAGGYLKGPCPFHHERTASFTVTPAKDIFYCFGCHQGGDSIAFIARAENCSQIEAARYIAERYNIKLPTEVTWERSDQTAEERRRYHELCALVVRWCQQELANNGSVQSYVTSRNINTTTREQFKIGYFPSGQSSLKNLIKLAQTEGFLVADLHKANIILEGKHSWYSPFEDRIIFPINDHMGQPCGFGGRIFRANDDRAKYYNSHDHTFFSKGSLLFGFDKAKKAIQQQESVFLVEGYIDCIAMVQAGFNNTVATLGTACSTEHLTTLGRYASELKVLYDGDAAGQKAILRLGQLCWDSNLELTILKLPTQEDPASYLQKEGTLEPLLAQPADLCSWIIQRLGTTFAAKRIGEKTEALRELLENIGRIKDPLKQDLILQKAALACNVPLPTLRHELQKLAHRPDNRKQSVQIENKGSEIREESFSLEKQIFCAILTATETISSDEEQFIVAMLPDSLRQILTKWYSFRTADSADFSAFFGTLDPEAQALTGQLLLHASAGTTQTLAELVELLKKKRWKIVVNDVKMRLAQAQETADSEQVQQILDEFQSLKRKMMRGGHV